MCIPDSRQGIGFVTPLPPSSLPAGVIYSLPECDVAMYLQNRTPLWNFEPAQPIQTLRFAEYFITLSSLARKSAQVPGQSCNHEICDGKGGMVGSPVIGGHPSTPGLVAIEKE